MDPSVRRSHTEDRRCQQALYEKDGYVGEGAFGVVMKAFLKQANTATLATGAAAGTGLPTAAESSSRASAPSAHATPKQYVAIKQMMNQREGQGIPQDAYREIKVTQPYVQSVMEHLSNAGVLILKELRHPNIVYLDRIFTRPDKHEIDLVYEYADHDLAEIIKVNRGKRVDPRFVKSVLQQILSGLAYLHKNWCIHRDLKPANILVTKIDHRDLDEPPGTGGGTVKIADFGLARIFQSPLRKLSDDGEVVTIWYRAPECLMGSKHYTRAIDIFAVGAIFFELLTCQPLFPGQELKGQRVFQVEQVKVVFNVLGKPTLEQWKGIADTPHYAQIKAWPQKDYSNTLLSKLGSAPLSAHGKHLLQSLLTYDPALRITAEAALQHPYFKEEPKPDKNVFKDAYGGWLNYPVRAIKPMSQAKRNREADTAAAQAAKLAAVSAALHVSDSAPIHPSLDYFDPTLLPPTMHSMPPYQSHPPIMPSHAPSSQLPLNYPTTHASSRQPMHPHAAASVVALGMQATNDYIPALPLNSSAQQRLHAMQTATGPSAAHPSRPGHHQSVFEDDNAYLSGAHEQQPSYKKQRR